MKANELTDVQRFYLMGHLNGDAKELATALNLKVTTVRKFLKANFKAPETSPAPEPSTPVVEPTNTEFRPARDLMGRTTGEGKQRGLAIMTGGASMAGDDARKAFREQGGESDDSSYIFRFDVKTPKTEPFKR